ncbi:MAG: enoyl-CoA hydratase/isomerase family protein [Rhizobiales bacterium]|nr:enoyl-CoA hydratase/isomerase family protein [Hyphomicrobiales bacterium]
MTQPELLIARRGVAGVVTLNRPRALNAITHGMVRTLKAQLDGWARDPAVTRVVLTAAGGRAFCAGGDIRQLYELGMAGRHAEMLAFYREEYVLNTLIKHYPKPYIALIDGLCMGGGVGLSIHGSHRIAGDRFQFAMPEVGIGFFPDVGATWFLPRLPGELGTYCALTGGRLDAADGVAATIATHRVPSDRIGALVDALARPDPVDAILASFAVPTGKAALAEHRDLIDSAFKHDRVEDILNALDAAGGGNSQQAPFAAQVAAAIRAKSPAALKVALAQVRAGAALSFEACMQTEFRIVSRMVHGHDFYEGVRAVIVDKDNAPRWRPATLAEVADADVARFFAPLGGDEWRLS